MGRAQRNPSASLSADPILARSGFGRLDRRDIQQSLDHLRFLRAGDGMAAGDDEAWHAVDAQPVRPEVVGVHGVHLIAAGEEARAPPPSRPQAAAIAASTRVVADVVAVGEMRREQRLHHRIAPAEARGKAHQPVGIDAGRGAADAVEAEQRCPRRGRSR